jgi:FhaA, N-terminal domain/FHA domain
MGMQALERRLERMVTGVFSRGARTNIRPIELGRRVVREMDDQRSIDVQGRRVVPNHFVVQLSQKDLDSFAEIDEVLRTELVEAAREYARSEGYHFLGPVAVELTADEEQRPGRFDVLATLRQADDDAPRTSTLVLPSGQRVELDDEAVTVGRLTESTITLSDQNVSRRHAEIRPNRQHYVVVDLGSTNGTMVNGVRIHGETVLSDGDIISFGSTYIRFEAS